MKPEPDPSPKKSGPTHHYLLLCYYFDTLLLTVVFPACQSVKYMLLNWKSRV
jgi:hypothetical protein